MCGGGGGSKQAGAERGNHGTAEEKIVRRTMYNYDGDDHDDTPFLIFPCFWFSFSFFLELRVEDCGLRGVEGGVDSELVNGFT